MERSLIRRKLQGLGTVKPPVPPGTRYSMERRTIADDVGPPVNWIVAGKYSCRWAGNIQIQRPLTRPGGPSFAASSRRVGYSRLREPSSLPNPQNLFSEVCRVAHPSQSHREGWVIRATREPSSLPNPKIYFSRFQPKKHMSSPEST